MGEGGTAQLPELSASCRLTVPCWSSGPSTPGSQPNDRSGREAEPSAAPRHSQHQAWAGWPGDRHCTVLSVIIIFTEHEAHAGVKGPSHGVSPCTAHSARSRNRSSGGCEEAAATGTVLTAMPACPPGASGIPSVPFTSSSRLSSGFMTAAYASQAGLIAQDVFPPIRDVSLGQYHVQWGHTSKDDRVRPCPTLRVVQCSHVSAASHTHGSHAPAGWQVALYSCLERSSAHTGVCSLRGLSGHGLGESACLYS